LIGGVLQIRPAEAHGTIVTCTLSEWRPVRARADACAEPENSNQTGVPA